MHDIYSWLDIEMISYVDIVRLFYCTTKRVIEISQHVQNVTPAYTLFAP
jgi:hypothetical protein